ncbi:MAG: hypothetical protein ACRDPC_28995 [Solirubrobacteraceae bacterium]
MITLRSEREHVGPSLSGEGWDPGYARGGPSGTGRPGLIVAAVLVLMVAVALAMAWLVWSSVDLQTGETPRPEPTAADAARGPGRP